MEKISVIIPIYQVKLFLEECICSVRNQSYVNLEIILIDDGSTDGSSELCDTYAEEDRRIIVIHQQNKGLSEARNVGLRICTGKYLVFVDSDDVLNQEYISDLYQLIQKYDADISICDYLIIKQNKYQTASEQAKKREYVLSADRMLKEWHGKRKRIETVVWNKMYKKDVFSDDIEYGVFPIGKNHEDIYTSHIFVSRSKQIAITEKKLYYYRLRENSITREKKSEGSIFQDLQAQKVRLEYFRNNNFWSSYIRLLVGHCIHRLKYMFF